MSTGADVSITMTLDEARVIASIQKIINAQRQQEAGVENTKKKYDDAQAAANKAAKESERFSAKVRETTATPLEKVEAVQNRVNDAIKRGHITQQQGTAYLEQYRQKVLGTGEAQQATFGSSAIEQVTAYATSVVSITAALAAVQQAFELVAEARKRALESSEQLNDPNRDLASLFQTPEEFQSALGERDRYAEQYGISREQASRILFTTKSGNFTEEDTRTAFETSLVTDPELASNLALKSQALFGGEISRRQAINVAFRAAADSPLEVKDIAQYLPTAAVSARAAGFSYEDTTALMTTLTERFKGPEQASDRLGTFLSKVALTEDVRGMEGLRELLADEGRLKKFAGDSKELNEVARVLQTDFEKAVGRSEGLREESARTGQDDDAINRAIRVRFSDPAEQAKLEKRQAEAAAETAREGRFAVSEAGRQQAYFDEQQFVEENRLGMAYRYGSSLGSGLGRITGSEFVQRNAQSVLGNILEHIFNPLTAFTRPFRGSVNDIAAERAADPIQQPRENSQQRPIDQEQLRATQQANQVLTEIRDEMRGGGQAMRGRETAERARQARART